MANIHPTAHVDPLCQLADDVEIGPLCVLTGACRLDAGVRLLGSVTMRGPVHLHAGVTVYPYAALGFPPQDLKVTPEDPTAGVVVHQDTVIREQAVVHAASNTETPTTVGPRNFLMATSHVGHDCITGADCILVTYAGLSGHVTLGDNVVVSGQAGVHQHCKVGRLAFLSGGVQVSTDIPPFCTVNERNRLGSVNLVGMRRGGIPREHITQTRRFFREALAPSIPTKDMLEALDETLSQEDCPPLAEMREFIANATRGVCPGAGRPPRMFAAFLRHARRTGADLDQLAKEAEREN